MELLYSLLSILLFSFGLNIIPFFGPSNLFIALNAFLIFQASPLIIGFLVALGSASAKFIHYLVAFFSRGLISEKRKKGLDIKALKVKRWAFLALFIAAVTPIPDEPVVIPLGLLRYSPAKFFLAYFTGKLVISIIGAYMGMHGANLLFPIVSMEILTVVSIVLTIAVTIVLLKVDVEKLLKKILKKKTQS